MNRKDFLSSVIPLAAAPLAFHNKSDAEFIKQIPPYLKKGDVIGITCPSGHISLEECQPAINKMKEWGFEIRIGQRGSKKVSGRRIHLLIV